MNMKMINSIQLVALFIALPFVISWLHTAAFVFAGAAFWAAIALYLVMIVFTVVAYYESFTY